MAKALNSTSEFESENELPHQAKRAADLAHAESGRVVAPRQANQEAG